MVRPLTDAEVRRLLGIPNHKPITAANRRYAQRLMDNTEEGERRWRKRS